MIRFIIVGEPALIKRFEKRFVIDAKNGCWQWLGAPSDSSANGKYGRFRIKGEQIKAHI